MIFILFLLTLTNSTLKCIGDLRDQIVLKSYEQYKPSIKTFIRIDSTQIPLQAVVNQVSDFDCSPQDKITRQVNFTTNDPGDCSSPFDYCYKQVWFNCTNSYNYPGQTKIFKIEVRATSNNKKDFCSSSRVVTWYSSNQNDNNNGLIIGLSVGGGVIIIIIAIVVYIVIKKRKQKKYQTTVSSTQFINDS